MDKHGPVQIRRLANEALVDMFNALGGKGWRNRYGWLTPGTDVKRWHGITVDTGRLVSLNLISNDLQGEIPDTVSNLVTLTELNMSYNFGITGVLPPEVGSMVSLTVLHLYSTGIDGPIPGSLSQLHNLQELWLNGNRLTGSIPAGLGELSQLRELYLNANELIGPIPQSFSALTNLEGLNVSWNQLTGILPSCLGNMVSLKFLALEGNDQLEGVPPAEHGRDLDQWLADKRAVFAGLQKGSAAVSETLDQEEQIRDVVLPQQNISTHLQRLGSNTSGCMINLDEEEKRQIVLRFLAADSPPTLQEVLRDEVGGPFTCAAFRTFAAGQLMEENVDFWVEVERFKAADEPHAQRLATDIMDRFIAREAQAEVNLSGAIRAATAANMIRFQTEGYRHEPEPCALSRSIFDQAQQQIHDLMDTAAFPLFLQSTYSAIKELA